jgi:chromosome segregation ATPase
MTSELQGESLGVFAMCGMATIAQRKRLKSRADRTRVLLDRSIKELLKSSSDPSYPLETINNTLDGLFEDIEAKYDLVAKVGNLEAKIGSLEAKVGSLEAKVGSLEAKVEQLRDTITVLGDEKSNLKQQMRSLETKLFFANSGLHRSRCLALSCTSV